MDVSLQNSFTPTVWRIKLGMIGKLFGDKEHAPINIAGATVLGLLLLLPVVAYFPVLGLSPALVSSMLTLALGYLFGRSQR